MYDPVLLLLTSLLLSTLYKIQARTFQHEETIIAWGNVTVYSPERLILGMGPGSIAAGRVLGVLGSSGSGKSTFLNILAQNWKSGGILVKESDMSSLLSKDDIGFVHQDDSFFGMLTVSETLHLAASLRRMAHDHPSPHLHRNGDNNSNNSSSIKHNSHTDKQVLSVLVKDMMTQLSLSKVADSRVGEIEKRGISGGERKRLAVGCELLGNPSLLIADESTSGLDSFQAQQVMNLLKDLAVSRNIAIIASLHQPRSSIFFALDDILLLTPTGRPAFHGPRSDILEYFARLGHTCPTYTNPAEFLIDLVSIDMTSPTTAQKCRDKVTKLADAFQTYNVKKNTHFLKEAADKIKSTPSSSSFQPMIPSPNLPSLIPGRRHPNRRGGKPGSGIASMGIKSVKRFFLLLSRSLRQAFRDNATNVVRFGVSALLAFVVGGVHGKQGDEISSASVSDRVNIIAQGAINVGMLSTIKALQLFKRERAVVERERSQQQYTALEYLIAKMTAELPLDAAVAAAFAYVLQERTNLHAGSGIVVPMLGLLGCVGSSLGLAIGALFPQGDVALAIGPALMVVYVIMGAIGPSGVGKNLNPLLRPLRDLSPFRWACEGLCAAEFKGKAFGTSEARLKRPKSLERSLQLHATHTTSATPPIHAQSMNVVGNLVRGIGSCARHLLSPLMSLRQLTKTSTSISSPTSTPTSSLTKGGREGWRRSAKGGDYVMDALGLADASIERSTAVLLKMLVMNSFIALLGLIFNQK